MSRFAQETQRLVDELKRKGKGRRMNDDSDLLGIEPEAPPAPAAEAAAQPDAPATDTTTAAAEGADIMPRTKKTPAAPRKRTAAVKVKPAAAKTPKAPKVPAAPREASDLTLKAEDPENGGKTTFMRSTKRIFRKVFALALDSGKLAEADVAAVTKLQGRLK